ncbi:ANTAR domain-containing protein [Streptomyces sp. VRA16 Mangrove soil]|uniref:ANTAR domain-containing protein n=1 Tax=Streptomyces sp. VRA16 Mangrove soil TaxID=2817434 RepID=UPI001A9E83B2|nr:GAF and ANTAR domain-containing protein [Streptomyces sp. VRA16 Mangrove soil]MBO1334275.1 GAF and ANTAR domain-containing protein [Streptomyces sp. VRA16 Mangrove soil]
MAQESRELRLAAVLVEFADTLIGDFDPVRQLGRLADGCVEILGARSAGVTLLEGDGRVGPVIHDAQQQQSVRELMEWEQESGPVRESLESGMPVRAVAVTSGEAAVRWPQFAAAARRFGIASVYAVPLLRHETLLGALSVYASEPPPQNGELAIAQILADATTVGLLNHRTYSQYRELAGQLQGALASRVRIEQAKGMLAERWRTTPDRAFDTLRQYARKNRLPLDQVARAVVLRTLPEARLRPDRPDRA